MLYDRKIKYFDYRKNDERIRSGGFAKIEARGGICNITLQISGLNLTDTFSRQVYLLARDREELLCDIDLHAGRGIKQLQLPMDNLGGSSGNKLVYEDLRAIRIPIAAGIELYCKITEEQEVLQQPVSEAEETVLDAPREMVGGTEEAEEEVAEEVKEETEEKIESCRIECVKEELQVENYPVEEKESPLKKLPMEQEEVKVFQMQEDKWRQLSAIYPHIKPFRDEREYLKLNPEDFVIFSSKSYKLVHNSFLLHGYYNYQHLILACVEQRGSSYYYIGVPGNFYDREKQVALMFGFESFECQTEPAGMGDYGYYMIRAEL